MAACRNGLDRCCDQSRLVALNKTDGGHRPIAVGELFYRLAGVIVNEDHQRLLLDAWFPFAPVWLSTRGWPVRIPSLQHLLTDRIQPRVSNECGYFERFQLV